MNADATAPGPDPRHDAFGTLFVVAQHLDRLGDAALAPLGLTTKQWLLLAVIEKAFAGRPPTLSEAAAVYGSSRQNVKAMARALASAGYLRLMPDLTDRRALRLVATDRTSVFASPAWRAREAAFFSFAFRDLSREEVSILAALLARWMRAVAAASGTTPIPADSDDTSPVAQPGLSASPERSIP